MVDVSSGSAYYTRQTWWIEAREMTGSTKDQLRFLFVHLRISDLIRDVDVFSLGLRQCFVVYSTIASVWLNYRCHFTISVETLEGYPIRYVQWLCICTKRSTTKFLATRWNSGWVKFMISVSVSGVKLLVVVLLNRIGKARIRLLSIFPEIPFGYLVFLMPLVLEPQRLE